MYLQVAIKNLAWNMQAGWARDDKRCCLICSPGWSVIAVAWSCTIINEETLEERWQAPHLVMLLDREALYSFLAWYQWCMAAPRKKKKSTTRRRHRNSDTDICIIAAFWSRASYQRNCSLETMDQDSKSATVTRAASLAPPPLHPLLGYVKTFKFWVQTTD
jgi:hypothetical protein